MALTVEVRINHKLLTYIKAERIQVRIQEYNEYNISIPLMDTLNIETGEVEWKKIGVITHKYSDGANVLSQKMLETMEAYK